MENTSSPTDNQPSSDERKKSPPAFLDLADSTARLGSNMPDMSARVELKRLEHERQRLMQRKHFEDQMRVLEQIQAQELLNIPYEPNGNGSIQHLAVSAPTTPPRLNAQLAVGNVADKRKSVTYAPSVNLSPDLATGPTANGHSFGAKSMPASRRTSASSHDEELAVHIQGLSLAGERSTRASPIPAPVSASILLRNNGRYEDEGARYASTYNAGMMLDEQLDKEMHNAMRNLPTSDDDKYGNTYPSKVMVLDSKEKSSEWPQFNGNRMPEGSAPRTDRRTVTNPNVTLSAPDDGILGGTVTTSATPLLQQQSQGPSSNQTPNSRRGSPHSLLDGLSTTTRSVPATPMGLPSTTAHLMKTPGTPQEVQIMNGRISAASSHQVQDGSANPIDLQPSLSRLPPGPYDSGSLTYNSVQSTARDDYETIYGVNGGMDNTPFNAYGFESIGPNNPVGSSGPGNLYPAQHGSRYGLSLPGRGGAGTDSKMNGLHGPKHKRGDVDREFNRFAGTRLEDLQGEIPALCKDQHGCRYLQKKLEEGVPEHRDMIFRETFGHFADLMTDPFGNYLCQKLLEYSTDDQRNAICESVAQDLVNISLNMHGTRAVQKMIDFLSTRRQTDQRYNAQIHSIILALSLHVVVLIKDLNGNHVIQKCLNKLGPEDNQFIYNAVAANCVEVATHRHGCCVLQRCIDHASEMQRVQLVNEITYNALTLVQDPYGNYVVQYILDLNDNRFSDAVIRQFTGNVCALSVQKFSSNVIEKCIRVAEHTTRKMLIEELLNRSRLEKLLRDSYGNYCVQTALDYAEPAQRALLVEGIRPVLPLIRNTPYGKRIQNKLQREQADHFGGFPNQQALVNMALSNQGMGAAASRHMHQGLAGNPLTDMYGSSSGLYSIPGQGSFGQSHLNTQMHGLQTQSIDGYVLQGNSNHNQGLPQQHTPSFPANSFANFGGAVAGSLNDPYQRSAFGYGM
ncbi:ARM repeat-containing protein [Gymnopilus junonius]|uniref:ARM repeat-containing protein n=1 Tax=Gymnopilus junonius TaxID=109634 RepID=A0A9P5TTM3_GYMJU|nr:ARM repeat-containing protein [Gymnopilus junonius]